MVSSRLTQNLTAEAYMGTAEINSRPSLSCQPPNKCFFNQTKNDKITLEEREDKEEFKKRVGRSPDKADALALTFAEPVYDTGKPKLYGNGYVTFDDLFNDAGKGTLEW